MEREQAKQRMLDAISDYETAYDDLVKATQEVTRAEIDASEFEPEFGFSVSDTRAIIDHAADMA